MMTPHFVWLDIETTGLDPDEDHLLEIGAVATTADLNPVDQFELTAALPDAWDPDAPDTWPIALAVRAMHTHNGLLLDCIALLDQAHSLQEESVVDDFLGWVRGLVEEGPLIAAGSGVLGFDLPWLKATADPDQPWPFHYRALDLSPIRSMLQLAGIDTHLDASSGPGKTHRALDDARAHLAEARLIRDTLTRMHRADTVMGHMIDLQDGPDANPPGGEL